MCFEVCVTLSPDLTFHYLGESCPLVTRMGTGSQITVWISRKFTVGQHILSPALQRELPLLKFIGTWIVLFGHVIISILK